MRRYCGPHAVATCALLLLSFVVLPAAAICPDTDGDHRGAENGSMVTRRFG